MISEVRILGLGFRFSSLFFSDFGPFSLVFAPFWLVFFLNFRLRFVPFLHWCGVLCSYVDELGCGCCLAFA